MIVYINLFRIIASLHDNKRHVIQQKEFVGRRRCAAAVAAISSERTRAGHSFGIRIALVGVNSCYFYYINHTAVEFEFPTRNNYNNFGHVENFTRPV